MWSRFLCFSMLWWGKKVAMWGTQKTASLGSRSWKISQKCSLVTYHIPRVPTAMWLLGQRGWICNQFTKYVVFQSISLSRKKWPPLAEICSKSAKSNPFRIAVSVTIVSLLSISCLCCFYIYLCRSVLKSCHAFDNGRTLTWTISHLEKVFH